MRNDFFTHPDLSRTDLHSDVFGTFRRLIPFILFGLSAPPNSVAAPLVTDKPFSVLQRQPSLDKSRALDLKGTQWSQVARRHGLDPYLLYAVALTESARIHGNLASPWFWALNRNGKSLYPDTSSEALEQIRHQLKAGNRNIDVGLMQVNLRWHRHRVGRIEDMLNPGTNLNLGAQILQEAIATAPDDLALGVGRYHAWSNRAEAHKYGLRVLRLADRLRGEAKRGE